jgi:hypothetical protein
VRKAGVQLLFSSGRAGLRGARSLPEGSDKNIVKRRGQLEEVGEW